MRILEIHQSHGIYGSDKVFEEISHGLRETGFEVYQFSLNENETQKNSHKFFLKTSNLNIFQNIFSLRIALALLDYIKTIKPDIIHFHTIDASIFGFGLPILYGKYTGAKVVKTQHDWGMICSNDWHVTPHGICNQSIKFNCRDCYQKKSEFFKHYFGKKWLRNPVYKMTADIITVPSLALCKDMKKSGFKNVRHIYNFIDVSELISNEKSQVEGNQIIFIGRLVRSKGLDELIEAFFQVKNRVPDAELHIVGKGSSEEILYLVKLIREKGLQNSIFVHANATNEEKLRLLSRSKVCIMPSVWKENNPLVLLEAFAARVPVIAFKIGGLPEIIQDERALAEWKNVHELAEKTGQVLLNENLRQELIGKNSKKLSVFDKKEIIRQWSDLFTALKEGEPVHGIE